MSSCVGSSISTSKKLHTWDLPALLSSSGQYAMLILSSAITVESATLIKKLWCKAAFRVCVDGGTNDYHQLIRASGHGGSTIQMPVCNGIQENVDKLNSANSHFFQMRNTNSHSNFHNSSEIMCESINKGKGHSSYSLLANAASVIPDGTDIKHKSCDINFSSKNVNETLPEKLQNVPLPHFISGDFDSVNPDILRCYANLGVQIIHTPDQNATDFTKALLLLKEHTSLPSENVHHILVASGIGDDRFDHVMANINTLHKCLTILAIPVPVLLLTQRSVLFLLFPGHSIIHSPGHSCPNLNWCSYVPMAGPATVTTQGLKYDVEATRMEFGGLVSTSNQFAAGEQIAHVTTDAPLLFISAVPPPTLEDEPPEGNCGHTMVE